ncbi:MAG: AAA family ATPase, partial [Chloroflexi bacterium]|nr:AAA family ATPase [Chloroflexota bacterium]
MAIIIAVTNQKGGVGKTTTAVNLGAALVECGYQVLVVDCDPQADATATLLSRPLQSPGIFELMLSQANGQPIAPETLVQPTICDHLDLLPACKNAAQNADAQFSAVMYRELLLSKG